MSGVAQRQHRYLNDRAENPISPRVSASDGCAGSSRATMRNALSRCTESSPGISDHDAICSPLPIIFDFVAEDFESGTWLRGRLPYVAGGMLVLII